jgi:hypothetical protein
MRANHGVFRVGRAITEKVYPNRAKESQKKMEKIGGRINPAIAALEWPPI